MRVGLLCCACVLLAVGFAGCLRTITVIKVKPDGSGYIEERLLATGGIASFLMPGITDESDDIDAAKQLYEHRFYYMSGALVIKAKKERDSTMKGVFYTHRFANINELIIETSDRRKKKTSDTTKNTCFRFIPAANGSPAQLTIYPKNIWEDDNTKKDDDKDMDSSRIRWMRSLFSGMKGDLKRTRIRLVMEPQGEVVENTATYPEGKQSVLYDFNAAMFEKEIDSLSFDTLIKMKDHPEEVFKADSTHPGMRFEHQDSVVIRFR